MGGGLIQPCGMMMQNKMSNILTEGWIFVPRLVISHVNAFRTNFAHSEQNIQVIIACKYHMAHSMH
jgi:hypothetical protein